VLSAEQVVVPVVYGQQVPEEAPPLVDGDLESVEARGFKVRLDNFEGPFDLLLQLIGKHKLDVTEIALHQVTDDFIAYIRAMGDAWDLEETSEFLLVAATLLDLKAARLLPAAEVEDEEDLALLEARDLLFARLLQYKAYKEAAAFIADLEGAGAKRWPRAVSMEPRYAEVLPDLVLGIGPERLFKLALKQFTPKPGPPQVSITHIHQMRVSVPEHAKLLRERLRRAGSATFSLLVADCESTLEVVARFLALLELYRQDLIDFEQPVSLDELTVRWIGGDDAGGELDVDDYEGSPPEPEAPPAESVTDADLADGELVQDDDPDDDGGPGAADSDADFADDEPLGNAIVAGARLLSDLSNGEPDGDADPADGRLLADADLAGDGSLTGAERALGDVSTDVKVTDGLVYGEAPESAGLVVEDVVEDAGLVGGELIADPDLDGRVPGADLLAGEPVDEDPVTAGPGGEEPVGEESPAEGEPASVAGSNRNDAVAADGVVVEEQP
jgi:segregation and condensation protein A